MVQEEVFVVVIEVAIPDSMSGREGIRSGGGDRFSQQGSPETVQEMGVFLHACEGDLVCKASIDKVPYFNAFIFKENKEQIGKIDEILGTINDMHFTVKLLDGLLATHFQAGDKVYIAPDKLLPLSRFLPQPKSITTSGAGVRKRTRTGMGGDSGRGGRGQIHGRGRGGFSRGRGHAMGGGDSFRGRGGGFGGFSSHRGRGGSSASGFRGRGGFRSGRGGHR